MPRWGPTCQAQHAARTVASTARAPPQHGGRGRPGAVAGDRREGAREGVGFLPSGDGRPAAGIDDDVAGATSAAARTETPWAAAAYVEEGGATGERAGGGGGVEEGGDGEERRRGAAAAATGNFGSTSPR